MNINKKSADQQRYINNIDFKEFSSEKFKTQEIKDITVRYRAALKDVLTLKEKYTELLQEMQNLKELYKAEMEKLLNQFRKQLHK